MNFIDEYFQNTIKTINKLNKDSIFNAINIIFNVKKNKGRIFFLGVGGSAANCSHAVNDFRKLCDLECYAPTDNVSELTARINDDGFEMSFANWLNVSKLNKNDLIFILSVGGGDLQKNISVNIINSIKFAKKRKSKIIGIVGRKNGYTAKNSNVAILVPETNKKLITPISESFQSLIWHLIVSHPKLKVNKTKW
jgi:D-sedoheptulose 7-phosphate isomerase